MPQSLAMLVTASFAVLQSSLAAPHHPDVSPDILRQSSLLNNRSDIPVNTVLTEAAMCPSSSNNPSTFDTYPLPEGDCSAAPSGAGPTVDPDTPEDFLAFAAWGVCFFKA